MFRKNIFKIFITVITIIYFLPNISCKAAAVVSGSGDSLAGSIYNITEAQKEASGYDDIVRNIPEFALDIFDNEEIDESDIDSATDGFSFKSVINIILHGITRVFKNDFGLFINIFILCMLCAIYNSLKGTMLRANMSAVYSCVIASCMLLCVISPIYSALGDVNRSIEQMSIFIKSSMPVFVTLTASAGYIGSASIINGAALMVCNFFAAFFSTMLIPITSIFFALSASNIIFRNKFIKNFSQLIKRWTIIIIGASLTLFVGIMSLKNIVSASADTLSKRTVKFAMGNMIPVAGGVISEAMETVYSCSGVLKSTAGMFGMIVIIFTVLMPVIALVSKIVFMKLANLMCELFGCDELTAFLGTAVDGLFIALSVLISIAIMLILCLTLVIMTGR